MLQVGTKIRNWRDDSDLVLPLELCPKRSELAISDSARYDVVLNLLDHKQKESEESVELTMISM